MFDSVKSYFSSNQDYGWSDYRKYQTLISNACSQLPNLPSISKITVPNLFASSEKSLSEMVWDYKEWAFLFTGLVAMGIAFRYFTNRKIAQKPKLQWETSLNCGKLILEVPKFEARPINVNFVFCIDTSTSMREVREKSVKSGIEKVIKSAPRVLTTEGSKIKMAAVGFDDDAHVISEPVDIKKASEEGSDMAELQNRIKKYKSAGGTSIVKGIQRAKKELDKMAASNPQGKNVLILLSDGEDEDAKRSAGKINQQLANIQFFSIGIGCQHDRETLKTLAGEENYIDTTKGASIEQAIARVYERSIATFSKMTVHGHGLNGTKWRANDEHLEGDSKMVVGSLSEGEKRTLQIEIDKGKELDLKRVFFSLAYRDPQGIGGEITLPWNPDSIIRPQVFN